MVSVIGRALAVCVTAALLATAYASPVGAEDGSGTDWTIMVYLDGDNSLDYDSYLDVEEMKAAGPPEGVNVIVLWDRLGPPAQVMKVNRDSTDLLSGLAVTDLLNGVVDYDCPDVNGREVLMSDPNVLASFIRYTATNFPAEHYMLDLWNHGWPYGVCEDNSFSPYWPAWNWELSWNQVLRAIDVGLGDSPGEIDLLAFDACSVGMAEVVYEFSVAPKSRDRVRYVIASEGYVPNTGYPYNHILARMAEMPDLSDVVAVGTMIADEYSEAYSAHGQYDGMAVGGTLSVLAVDIAKASALAKAVRDLTAELRMRLECKFSKWHDLISYGRGEGNLPWGLNGDLQFVDLMSFATAIAKKTKDGIIKSLASRLAEAVDEVVVYVGNTPSTASIGVNGMGIWFPSSYENLERSGWDWIDVMVYVRSFAFAEDSGWAAFLFAYWKEAPPDWW